MTASNIFDPRPTTYYDENGQIASGAKAYFFRANTNTPLTVYTDQALTTPHAFPVVANSRGVLPVVYLPYVDYRVLIHSANDIVIYDAPYIPNEAPPSSGGGLVVTSTQIYRTGHILISPFDDPIDGFVRMNGRTLGSGSSGATEYAGTDGHDLFVKLYNKYSDTRAPVSGGRGAGAEEDWSANKTITIPDARGRSFVGSDTMGNIAANVAQVSTTISVTNGSPTATVASAAGLSRRMKCLIDGTNTATISAISGTTITFSANYSGLTNAAASFRASFFEDAQSAGAVGGSQTITQNLAELPAHTHALDEGDGHQHELNAYTYAGYPGGYTVYGVSGGSGGSASTDKTKKATTGATITSTGLGLPLQIVQPGFVATIYLKL